MLDTLTLEDFAPHVGADFMAGAPGAPCSLTLISATPLRARGGPRISFSLLFRGAAAPLLDQRIHRLVHPTRGAVDIFLVPVGSDAGGAQYEAIFN